MQESCKFLAIFRIQGHFSDKQLKTFWAIQIPPSIYSRNSEKNPGWSTIRKWSLIGPCQTKVTSDQTIQDQSTHRSHGCVLEKRVQSEYAPSCPWSELVRQKWPLTRPKSDHCSNDWAFMAQIKHRLMSRRLCAQNYFLLEYCLLASHSWSYYCALEIASNQNQFLSEEFDQWIVFTTNESFWFCYIILIS